MSFENAEGLLESIEMFLLVVKVFEPHLRDKIKDFNESDELGQLYSIEFDTDMGSELTDSIYSQLDEMIKVIQ